MLFLILFILLIGGCQDEVEITLSNTKEQKLVVEGFMILNSIFSGYTFFDRLEVKLSKSSNYLDKVEITNFITDAKIILISKGGKTIDFNYLGTGIYTIFGNAIKLDSCYKLHIETAEGKIYESTYQKVLKPVEIDSVTVFPYSYLLNKGYLFNKLGEDSKDFLTANFKDTKGVKNYYAWNIVSENSSLTKILDMKILSDEDIVDGSSIPFEYLWFDFTKSVPYETTLLQLSLNKNAFNYIQNIQSLQQLSSPFSSPPSNPLSNISCISNPKEEVLGFFEISTASSKIYK